MVYVNKEKCIGCGLCKTICPEVFDLGEDGKAKIISNENIPCVREAAAECPVNAINE